MQDAPPGVTPLQDEQPDERSFGQSFLDALPIESTIGALPTHTLERLLNNPVLQWLPVKAFPNEEIYRKQFLRPGEDILPELPPDQRPDPGIWMEGHSPEELYPGIKWRSIQERLTEEDRARYPDAFIPDNPYLPSGSGQRHHELTTDPQTREVYGETAAIWDLPTQDVLDKYIDAEGRELTTMESLSGRAINALNERGEPFAIYDRFEVEPTVGPYRDELDRPFRGFREDYSFPAEDGLGRLGVPDFSKMEKSRPTYFRERIPEFNVNQDPLASTEAVRELEYGPSQSDVERSPREPLVPGRSEWGFPDDPAARALQVEEALEAVYTEYPGLRIFNIDVQDFRDRAPFSGEGQLEFLASTDQGPETARREDRGNLRQTEGPYAGRFRPTVELFEGVIGEDLAKSIFGDMLHHFSEKDEQGEYIEDRGVAPDFQRLLDDFHDTMYEVDEQTLDYKDDTPEAEAQRRWNDRVYQINVNEYGEGRPFDQWYDASHLDGLVRGFLAPDNNAELITSRGYPWKGEEEQGWYTERQRGILNQMRNLLRTGGRR